MKKIASSVFLLLIMPSVVLAAHNSKSSDTKNIMHHANPIIMDEQYINHNHLFIGAGIRYAFNETYTYDNYPSTVSLRFNYAIPVTLEFGYNFAFSLFANTPSIQPFYADIAIILRNDNITSNHVFSNDGGYIIDDDVYQYLSDVAARVSFGYMLTRNFSVFIQSEIIGSYLATIIIYGLNPLMNVTPTSFNSIKAKFLLRFAVGGGLKYMFNKNFAGILSANYILPKANEQSIIPNVLTEKGQVSLSLGVRWYF